MGLIDFGNGVRLERAVKCRMSDGITLVSDHYYPSGAGPWPTLLMRQPYGRDIASTVVYAHPAWFARQGFHVVIQDVRGRGDSEGEFYPFRNEASDGAETIAWVHSHAACNGRIGMYGFSYQGATQLLAATRQPQGLQCIAPHMTAVDLYQGWFYHRGALRLAASMGWGIQMLREDARRLGLHDASARLELAWANVRAQSSAPRYVTHPAIADELLPSYVRDWMNHRNPGPYWSGQDVSECVPAICIPALHIAGWFDLYLEGSIAGYRALCERAGTAFAREHQYLIAGPWVHIPWGDTAGELNCGSAANIDTDEILLRWFTHWLMDSDEFSDEPKVRYYALGANTWRADESWGNEPEFALYLQSGGDANSRKGDGRLSRTAPDTEEPRDVFVYDPEVPVVAPGGPQALSGSFDQATLELGNNLLVYTSEPSIRPMAVAGSPRISLHASTSAGCADFTAKLVRVTANDRAEFLCVGIARSSWMFPDGYAADEVRTWEFSLEPIAFDLLEGERLRLEIAGSAFPLYDRNPSTAVEPQLADAWSWERSTHQVLHTRDFPSALFLPVRGDAAW